MARDTAQGSAANDWQGLSIVFLFSACFAAAFYFGGVQHLRLQERSKPIAFTQTEDYRSGFARGWDVALADNNLSRSSSPQDALGKFGIRSDQFGGDYNHYRLGFLAGYEDGWKIDHAPNAPKVSKTAAK